MLIRISKPHALSENDVTPREMFLNRRRFIQGAGAVGGAALLGSLPFDARAAKLTGVKKTAFDPGEELTPYKAVTSYNNFYEFGTGKDDPAENAKDFEPKPWTVEVDGQCAKPGRIDFDALIGPHALEERIYRFRCVEAWSMVVPWVGVPLADVLKRFEPNSKAKYVGFETLKDPRRMPGQYRPVLDWPYREGLRIDEAMNPLTLLAVGLYGEELPNQNGAPLRLIVPWKYGFKSIKSIVRITFTDRQPDCTWNMMQPREYGFYSNVNPDVDHPRWSQGSERRIGEFFRRDTLPFNGYADEVAHLYEGMDLEKYF